MDILGVLVVIFIVWFIFFRDSVDYSWSFRRTVSCCVLRTSLRCF